jgi:hypothetical protein
MFTIVRQQVVAIFAQPQAGATRHFVAVEPF